MLFSKFYRYMKAFTLTEMLLAILIVGIISGLVLPAVITRFQNNILNHAFEREKQSLADLINQLAVDEHAGNFHNTIMYLEPKKDDDDSEYDFENSSGVFLNKYLRISKYCGTGKGDCFAPVYYSHEKKGVKKVFDFKPEGSCAILKNGMSLCIKPQIGNTSIQGWIDLNGKKGPNVLNRDLREFSLDLQEKAAFNQATRNIRNYCEDYPDAEVCGGENPQHCTSSDLVYGSECCKNAPTHPNCLCNPEKFDYPREHTCCKYTPWRYYSSCVEPTTSSQVIRVSCSNRIYAGATQEATCEMSFPYIHTGAILENLDFSGHKIRLDVYRNDYNTILLGCGSGNFLEVDVSNLINNNSFGDYKFSTGHNCFLDDHNPGIHYYTSTGEISSNYTDPYSNMFTKEFNVNVPNKN